MEPTSQGNLPSQFKLILHFDIQLMEMIWNHHICTVVVFPCWFENEQHLSEITGFNGKKVASLLKCYLNVMNQEWREPSAIVRICLVSYEAICALIVASEKLQVCNRQYYRLYASFLDEMISLILKMISKVYPCFRVLDKFCNTSLTFSAVWRKLLITSFQRW